MSAPLPSCCFARCDARFDVFNFQRAHPCVQNALGRAHANRGRRVSIDDGLQKRRGGTGERCSSKTTNIRRDSISVLTDQPAFRKQAEPLRGRWFARALVWQGEGDGDKEKGTFQVSRATGGCGIRSAKRRAIPPMRPSQVVAIVRVDFFTTIRPTISVRKVRTKLPCASSSTTAGGWVPSAP